MSLNTPVAGRGRWIAFGGAGILAILAAFVVDDAVTGACVHPVHDTARRMAELLSQYGDWPPILLAGLLLVTVLVKCRRIGTARLLLLVLAAGLLTGLGSTLIRSTVGRTRPNAAAPQGFYGLRHESRWIIGQAEFSSFPSGHTAVWAGLAGAAWFRRRWWAVAFLAGGAAVAWSRMALGCHHFSDVTASLVWGLAVGPWVCNLLEKHVHSLWSGMGLPSSDPNP
jgi:membrane-associated phospholipid phosphatase